MMENWLDNKVKQETCKGMEIRLGPREGIIIQWVQLRETRGPRSGHPYACILRLFMLFYHAFYSQLR